MANDTSAERREPLLPSRQSAISPTVDDSEEHLPIVEIQATRARWWILLQYSLLAFNQGWYWDIPGPIFEHYSAMYNLSQDTLQALPPANPPTSCRRSNNQLPFPRVYFCLPRLNHEQLFVNYGAIFFLVSSLPFAFLMDRPNGFRPAVLVSAFCNLVGCIMRLMARSASESSLALLHASYITNAFGGPVAISAPALVANAWFPASERGLATGVAVAFNTFGLVFSFFVGPLLVQAADFEMLMTYMYACAASAALNFICIALYFPSSPHQPPSVSAAVYARANSKYNWHAAKSLIVSCARNKSFVVLSLSYGAIGGLYSGWSALETPNLFSFGVSEGTAGMISGASIALAAAAAIALGGTAGKQKNHKRFLVILLLVGLVGVITWSTMRIHVAVPALPATSEKLSMLSALSVLIAVGFYSCTPIFFDAAVEASHPLPQGGVIMLMTFVFNLFSIAILAVPVRASAFNWTLSAAAAAVAWAMTALYQNQSNRSKLDEQR